MQDKKIGVYTACTLVIANMIGTGVFSSLGFQVAELPSAAVLLFLWVCGGLVALCGGLSYVELARLYPGSGGEYHYIKSVYPRLIGYCSGAVSIVAGFAAPVALAAITFSKYFGQFYESASVTLLSMALVTLITLFHCFSLRLGSGFQLATTAVKILVLLLFIVAGFFAAGKENPVDLGIGQFQMVATKGFAVSLVYVSFAYSGWNACVYIYSEIRNPEKNIRRSILAGTAIVTLLYILLNYVFLKTVSMSNLEGVIEVGAVSAKAIFGDSGGKWMAGIISILLISTISAMTWVGPRVIDQMMRRGSVLKANQQPKIPLVAIMLQFVLTMGLLLTETFEQILITSGLVLNVSSCLCIAILFFNKNRIPAKKMLAPVIFLIANLYTIAVLIA